MGKAVKKAVKVVASPFAAAGKVTGMNKVWNKTVGSKGTRSFLRKAAAPVLATGGFLIGGPAGAAAGAALGTRLSQVNRDVNWKRVARSGAIGLAAGAGASFAMQGGLGALAEGAKAGATKAGSWLAAHPGTAVKGAMTLGKMALGGGGGQPGAGGGTLQGMAGLYGAYQGMKGQEGALDDVNRFEGGSEALIRRQTELAGLDPVVAAQMKHQASQDLRASQAERGIFESGVAAKQEAELMPQIDQQQRAWQLQQLAAIQPQYTPLMESAYKRAGMYGTGEDAGGALAGLDGGGRGSDLLAGLAGKAWDTGKDWLSGLWGGGGDKGFSGTGFDYATGTGGDAWSMV